MTAGAFEIVNEDNLDDYAIEPASGTLTIPEDQRELYDQICWARGVLRLLRERGVLADEGKPSKGVRKHPVLEEFQKRIQQIARAGLMGSNVRVQTAVGELEQLRKEFVLRKGKRLAYLYLLRLGFWAGLGAVVGLALVGAATKCEFVSGLAGYGWVIVGATAGAWVSVASTRRDVAFDDIPGFLSSPEEPAIRMAFVSMLGLILALFLQLKIVSVALGEVSLATFDESVGVALLLGVVSGIGEKTMSVRIIERAREIMAP